MIELAQSMALLWLLWQVKQRESLSHVKCFLKGSKTLIKTVDMWNLYSENGTQ